MDPKSQSQAPEHGPDVFIIIIPAIAAMLPGVDLNAKLALVPILNVSLLCKELVIGTYHWKVKPKASAAKAPMSSRC